VKNRASSLSLHRIDKAYVWANGEHEMEGYKESYFGVQTRQVFNRVTAAINIPSFDNRISSDDAPQVPVITIFPGPVYLDAHIAYSLEDLLRQCIDDNLRDNGTLDYSDKRTLKGLTMLRDVCQRIADDLTHRLQQEGR
jgi:hypothetical protein